MEGRSRALRTLCACTLALAVRATPQLAPPSTAATPRSLTVWLDWYPNSDHAGIYVALTKGYYAQVGLRVEPRVPAGAADALALVVHGTGDIGISYEPTVLLVRAQGIPVRATAAIVQRPLNAVLAPRGTGITRPPSWRAGRSA